MRTKLIETIAKCNDTAVKIAWIKEMSEAKIECTESECTTDCVIYTECLIAMEQLEQETCENDCKIDDNERCGGCKNAK